MDKTQSPLGKKLLRKWFLSPFLDLQKREDRLCAISFFYSREQHSLVTELRQTLRGVKDIQQILRRIRGVNAALTDWIKLFQTLVNILKIFEIVRPFQKDLPLFEEIAQKTTQNLLNLTTTLYSTIDFDESREQKRLIPKDGVNLCLDQLRQTYNSLEGFLTDLGEEELQKLSSTHIDNIRCVYYPQIGFQIAIPREECEKYLDPKSLIIEGCDLQFQFLTSSLYDI
jgi:DNA mismatch repair protein MSH5